MTSRHLFAVRPVTILRAVIRGIKDVNTLSVAIVAITIALNAGMGLAGLTASSFVLDNADRVRAPRSWVPFLGAIKLAGALGLLLGLLGIPIIGAAAAAGLVAFFVCAIGFHVRAGALSSIAFPGFFLALAGASLFVIAK